MLASWEDIGGAKVCSITTSSACFPVLLEKCHPKELGKEDCWGQMPRSALPWAPPSWWKGAEKRDLRGWWGIFPYIGFLEDAGRKRGSLSKETASWNSHLLTAIISALQQLQMDCSTMCCCVSHAKATNKVFWRNIALPCLFNFAFPRCTYRHCKLSIRIHATTSLFTIRRVSCSQSSPTCKFFTILFS